MDLTLLGETASFLDRYKGNLAINVKYYGNPWLSEETLAALKKLDMRTRERVVRFAEENLRESWWATMRERSHELGLGDLWSDGRSGGWLVFAMTVADLEERVYQAERGCEHCALAYSTHTDGACPFDATTYKTNDPVLGLWKSFKQFAEEARSSLNDMGDALNHEIEFQLENLDADAATELFPAGSAEAASAASASEVFDDGAFDGNLPASE